MNDQISALISKGVCIPAPQSIEIGQDVKLDRISSKGVTIHAGCKIYGAQTLILDHVKLGEEAPASLTNCQIGRKCRVKGGTLTETTLVAGVNIGSGAQIREGTILEESASTAHCVGLKQTILFPYVTLGSLINFCDCFMAGGTHEKNHSEVGSSYIHFNFTPNQDKATPSLIGDVPKGVWLDQYPIFLGGQGGLVGPSRLTYGIVVAAGTIYRKDELRPNRLIIEGVKRSGNVPYTPGLYQNIKRLILNNLTYIGNLFALKQWYLQVRSQLISEHFPQPLLDGLVERISSGIDERIKRLNGFAQKLEVTVSSPGASVGADDNAQHNSKTLSVKEDFCKHFKEIEDHLKFLGTYQGNARLQDQFLSEFQKEIESNGHDYLTVIKNSKPQTRKDGVNWLQDIVDYVVSTCTDHLSTFN